MQRALAFERAMHAAAGGRVITASWGQAFLDGSLPLCHERNALWAIDDAGGADAATLDAAAERLLGDAGLAHRRIVLEEAAHRRLRDELPARGYGGSVHVYLAHSGPAPAAVDGVAVVEVAPEAVLVANDRYLLTDPGTPYGRPDATRAQLLEHHRTYGPAGAQERRFAVLGDDGAVAAWARLWVRGDEAQVEDVVCLAEHRGRGYGRAVVAAATRAALAAGPALVFIVADDDDWPKELYGRLGYGRIGHIGVFLRLVPGAAEGARP
ncbi:MAG: hypothetical protein QOF26_2639 [Baekduia sp.]|nr:hypothetical protein [Baekduia sp.]